MNHVSDTDCRPDIPRCVGRTLLLVEALRSAPKRPETLVWAPQDSVEYVDLDGIRVRCIKTGAGSNLVLLHTLRNPARHIRENHSRAREAFTVHAFDYPGHGWSDIPKAAYAPRISSTSGRRRTSTGRCQASDNCRHLDRRDDLAGVGGAPESARDKGHHRQSLRLLAGGRIRKSSLAARLVLTPSGVPVLGATIMRLRNRCVSDRIFEGGLASPEALPKELAEEFYGVGARSGHYRSFLSLLAHERLWAKARDEYVSIKCPFCSSMASRIGRRRWKGSARDHLFRAFATEIVPNGNHFLSLDRPRELAACDRRLCPLKLSTYAEAVIGSLRKHTARSGSARRAALIVLAALAPASPRPRVWQARASVHRGRAAPHSCWGPCCGLKDG